MKKQLLLLMTGVLVNFIEHPQAKKRQPICLYYGEGFNDCSNY
jgi:hypothetical protein